MAVMPPDVDELELLLEEELELELLELDDELELLPVQLAAAGLLPVTVSESIFASPSLPVATRLILFWPLFNGTFALTDVQLVHEPVDGNPTVATLAPLICTLPDRLLLEPFA
jgi:hypothetical protein